MADVIRGNLDGNREVIEIFDIRLMQAGPARLDSRSVHAAIPARIQRDSVHAGELSAIDARQCPLGGEEARYEIDLDLAGAEEVELERALELMGVT